MKSETDYFLDNDDGGGITSKIRAKMALLVRELAVMERLQIAEENAERYRENAAAAWKTAEALEARIAKMADALRRSAGHLKDV